MLEKKMIEMYYFSGTGNTLRIAQEVISHLGSKGYRANLIPMSSVDPSNIPLDRIIGLAFPVAIQSTFPLVWEFINNMPDTDGTRVFMIDTMQLFSGGIVGPVKKVLENKGYDCIGAKEFKMPSSMETNRKRSEKREEIIDETLKEVGSFVEDLINQRTTWTRIPVLSDMMRNISKGTKIWIDQSKKISIDTSKCVKCRLCENNCPMKCLKIYDRSFTIDYKKCISCMRCVNSCPRNSFSLHGKQVIQHMQVNVLELEC